MVARPASLVVVVVVTHDEKSKKVMEMGTWEEGSGEQAEGLALEGKVRVSLGDGAHAKS